MDKVMGAAATADGIRRMFLDFFAARGHAVVASGPIVPEGDPTLMFANSGMVQFKDVFLGHESRPYKRAASVQACLRAGGKHNDLENVGHTARHHTFFEMLGNWSFGDYFKRDAILWAWELLTEGYKLDPERLWATVYVEDDEAYAIWTQEVGLPAERVVRIGDNKGGRHQSDNFWTMADTGPCGPCSEIFYDHGPGVAGGPPGSPEQDGDRYVEIWNNVFMQFDMQPDGSLRDLPAPCVDTGMGLERLAAILQGSASNYGIDLFQGLISDAAERIGTSDLGSDSLKVVADHLRACCFLVAGGVSPSNEGRGHVLRRILRRAVRHGWKLGAEEPFMHALVPGLVERMGAAYPNLVQEQSRIQEELLGEERRFFETIAQGMKLLDSELARSPASLSGSAAFKLHDTFGFPLDLTRDVCRERGAAVDEDGFAAAMARQQEMGRSHGKFQSGPALDWQGPQTDFVGYRSLSSDSAVLAIVAGGQLAQELRPGTPAELILDRTPFYAEGGGQRGDSGAIAGDGWSFRVDEAVKARPGVWAHRGELVSGALALGAKGESRVDAQRRADCSRNHSATHLLHRALEEVLGPRVKQMGSSVDDQRTRFDFAHGSPLTRGQLDEVERRVNAAIVANEPAHAQEMPIDEARASGAKMLFGEKYGQSARVVSIGDSKELCGGTHVARSGDIGMFRIRSESGVSSGVRRIEALTGLAALAWTQARDAQLRAAAAAAKAPEDDLAARVHEMGAKAKAAERELAAGRALSAAASAMELAGSMESSDGAWTIAAHLARSDAASLRPAAEALARAKPDSCVALCSSEGGRPSIAVCSLTARISAAEVAKAASAAMGGQGGGKAAFAMAAGAQGSDPERGLAAARASMASQLAAAPAPARSAKP